MYRTFINKRCFWYL